MVGIEECHRKINSISQIHVKEEREQLPEKNVL